MVEHIYTKHNGKYLLWALFFGVCLILLSPHITVHNCKPGVTCFEPDGLAILFIILAFAGLGFFVAYIFGSKTYKIIGKRYVREYKEKLVKTKTDVVEWNEVDDE